MDVVVVVNWIQDCIIITGRHLIRLHLSQVSIASTELGVEEAHTAGHHPRRPVAVDAAGAQRPLDDVVALVALVENLLVVAHTPNVGAVVVHAHMSFLTINISSW